MNLSPLRPPQKKTSSGMILPEFTPSNLLKINSYINYKLDNSVWLEFLIIEIFRHSTSHNLIVVEGS
jgi:hypothetical protein